MKLLMAVCSEGTSVDIFTKKLSIFNVLSKIQALSFPLWITEMALTMAVEKEPNEPADFHGKIVVELGSNLLHEGELTLNFQEDGVARTVITLGLAVPAPGTITFSIRGPGVDMKVTEMQVIHLVVETNSKAIPA